ncbi:MAG TPA: DUF1177 domain-containing protein [Firmicutes bacterium]|jgi:hypothetical protein|nr:hypothetical protein [Bacillota bacterium]HHV57455.1 DUF1177 domain-containing protein [Bacillota bacterium]
MTFKATLEAYDLLDDARVDGERVRKALLAAGLEQVKVTRVDGPQGFTDFVQVVIPGTQGRQAGGPSPTLGVVGRLGGIGARPERIGLVSDGDGAVAALALALKLARMQQKGDVLPGDVIISTHICPHAPTQPHEPVPFMGSPVDMAAMNRYEVTPEMEAVLSIDTTKGNRIINQRGFAITPTVKEGYILRVSEDLLDIMQMVSGRLPAVLAITTQDITPYGNGVFHLNSLVQPATATAAPVVGVAITAQVAVPGCGTGASHVVDIEETVRFALEAAKAFGAGKCRFYDEGEYQRLLDLYGSLAHLKTLGRPGGAECSA